MADEDLSFADTLCTLLLLLVGYGLIGIGTFFVLTPSFTNTALLLMILGFNLIHIATTESRRKLDK